MTGLWHCYERVSQTSSWVTGRLVCWWGLGVSLRWSSLLSLVFLMRAGRTPSAPTAAWSHDQQKGIFRYRLTRPSLTRCSSLQVWGFCQHQRSARSNALNEHVQTFTSQGVTHKAELWASSFSCFPYGSYVSPCHVLLLHLEIFLNLKLSSFYELLHFLFYFADIITAVRWAEFMFSH